MTTIDLVEIRSKFVLLSDGVTMPITEFIDEDGEDCEADEATFCVAGPHPVDGFWLTVEIFDDVVYH